MNEDKQADDRFLAACSALLVAMAGRPALTLKEAMVLLFVLPDVEMRQRFDDELRRQPWVEELP